MKKGLIEVYTGDGKGKTTAAVGLAVRALGRGLRVCYISFHKVPGVSGELKILRKLGAGIFHFAPWHPSFRKGAGAERIRKECLAGLKFIEKAFARKKYDLVIIDEINISLRDGFLKEEEVGKIIRKKPAGMELVITGRGAPGFLLKAADLVSEIKKIKQPFDSGVKARKGIEY
jgi:cob(I)alamin adenosyltransferase